MACGKPVIVTNVGGIPEIIKNGDNGVIIPRGDYISLATAIKFLFDNPNYSRKLGEKAKKTVYRRLSLDASLQKYLRTLIALTK